MLRLKATSVALKETEQPVDTGTAAGKAFLDMLACSPNSKPIRLGIDRASVYRMLGKHATVSANGGADADQA